MSLETAVRRLTRDPAELYGLGDRGVIEPGRKADLNLIDYDRLLCFTPSRSPTSRAVPAA